MLIVAVAIIALIATSSLFSWLYSEYEADQARDLRLEGLEERNEAMLSTIPGRAVFIDRKRHGIYIYATGSVVSLALQNTTAIDMFDAIEYQSVMAYLAKRRASTWDRLQDLASQARVNEYRANNCTAGMCATTWRPAKQAV